MNKLMTAVEVKRDPEGFWYHPGLPDFDEGQESEYLQWLKDQSLVTKFAMLESEDENHPVCISYFENEDGDFSAWVPTPPAGDGWFTISIHDTEDGPCWVWARREKIEPEEPHCIHCNDSGEGQYPDSRCNYCAKTKRNRDEP